MSAFDKHRDELEKHETMMGRDAAAWPSRWTC